MRVRDLENDAVLAKGKEVDRLYRISLDFNNGHQNLLTEKVIGELIRNERAIRNLENKSLIPSATFCNNLSNCHSCMIKKSHNLPRKESSIAYSPLQLIFLDI